MLQIDRRCRAEVLSGPTDGPVISTAQSRCRAIVRDEDLSELQAAVRLNHHDIAPLEQGIARRKSDKSPYLSHDSVAYQIRGSPTAARFPSGSAPGMIYARSSARRLSSFYQKRSRD